MKLLDIVFYLQGACTVIAIITNMFLVYLIMNYTKKIVGKYKYLLIYFSCFETIYSIIVFFGMPTHFMADRSWLVFTYGGFIGNTGFAFFGPGLYCTFYDVWVGLVAVHFIYRYVVVCKEKWASSIEDSFWLRAILIGLYLGQIFYSAFCAFYFCMFEGIPPVLRKMVHQEFGVEHPEHVGYILLRTTDAEGNFSIQGTMTIVNHYILEIVSIVIILYCGVKVWFRIRQLQKTIARHQNGTVYFQRQIFLTLVIQTMVPVVFCHIPTIIYLTFPFWNEGFSFGDISTVFSLLTSINKFCDPIIVIFCLSDYRKAAKRILSGQSSTQVVHLTASSGASSKNSVKK